MITVTFNSFTVHGHVSIEVNPKKKQKKANLHVRAARAVRYLHLNSDVLSVLYSGPE